MISRPNFSGKLQKISRVKEKKFVSFTNVSVGICKKSEPLGMTNFWKNFQKKEQNKDQNWFSLIILDFEGENPQNKDFWGTSKGTKGREKRGKKEERSFEKFG